MQNDSYGKTFILKEQVFYIHEDTDLELFAKCCEEVCKIYMEVENEKSKTVTQT